MSYKYPCSRTDDEVGQLLRASCSGEWQKSSVIIGKAMLQHKSTYGEDIGDLVLEERLRCLAAAGAFEIDDTSLPYGQYSVRLSDAPGP